MRIDAKDLPDVAIWNVIDARTGGRVLNVLAADDEKHDIEVLGWLSMERETQHVPKVIIDTHRRVVIINFREDLMGDADSAAHHSRRVRPKAETVLVTDTGKAIKILRR